MQVVDFEAEMVVFPPQCDILKYSVQYTSLHSEKGHRLVGSYQF